MHPDDIKALRPEGPSNRPTTDMAPIELNTDDIIGRMKEVMNLTTDAQLSRALGTSNKNVSSWRKRNHVPYDDVLMVALNNGTSMEYILTGKPNPGMLETLKSSPFDWDILRIVARGLIKDEHMAFLDEDEVNKEAEFVASTIVVFYDRYINLMRQATANGRMSKAEFITALRTASSKEALVELVLRAREARTSPE